MTAELVSTVIAAGAGTIILLVIGGVVWAAVLLLRRSPDAQHDAFSFANDVLKQSAELSAEIREDGKRREVAAAAHVAALNATTEALKSIVTQQTKDSAALGNITTAVTTQADARHREVMGAFDIQAGFYPALIEELRMVKSAVNDLGKSVRKRKYGKPAPVRGALQRIEKQLEKISHETHITYPPQLAPRAPLPLDWRGIIHSTYGASTNGQSAAVANGNGNGNSNGWNTNDA